MIVDIDRLPRCFAEVCPKREGETVSNWHRRVAREFGLSISRVNSLIYDKRCRLSADEAALVQLRVLRKRYPNEDIEHQLLHLDEQLESDEEQAYKELLHEFKELRRMFVAFVQEMHGRDISEN